MVGNLYTSFIAHIENISKALSKLMIDHQVIRDFLDEQTINYKKLKKATCDVGGGMKNDEIFVI